MRRLFALAVALFALVGIALSTARPAQAAPPDLAPVVAFMRAEVGKPYVWGAEGPAAWDCSSLVQAAYRTVGVQLPRVTQDQVHTGIRVTKTDIAVGDLVFGFGNDGTRSNPGHVGMYVGDGQVIEAKGVRWGVVVSQLTDWKPAAIIRPTVPSRLEQIFDETARREGIPKKLLFAQAMQESGLNPRAASPVGARGIAQFMPGTWKTWGRDGDPLNPEDAIPAQGRLMAELLRVNGGDVGRALAGYNAGQSAVQKYNGIPPYKETQNYVRIIESDSGISGRIELHPTPGPPPAPLPARVVQAAGREVVRTVTPPSLPDSPTDAVHDLVVGVLAVLAAAGLLARFAPQLQALVWRAATPPRRSGRVTAGYVARAVSAAAVRGGVRRAERVRAARRPDRFHRTSFPSPSRRASRRPDGWAAPSRPLRRPHPSPTRPAPQGTAPGHRNPHRNTAPHRNRTALRWLRWPHRNRTAAPQPGTASTARPTAPQPAAPQPAAPQSPQTVPPQVPAPRVASVPAERVPTPQRPPHHPTPQGRGLTVQNRAPIDINPFDYLTDQGFDRLLRVPEGMERLNYSNGETVVALVVYLDLLTTAFAEGGDRAADEIAARAFNPSVVKEMREAAAKVGEAADLYRMAAKQLIDKHPDLFDLRVSKDAGPIGHGTTVPV
ncbi:hypothetical protein FDG2_0433 [Candidatus Protofrankia californiensis]|uniref:NlpC/P60 domain-containing protein n=1 Tax=Candidatus Protofrankia californiensis TaxID=1839754 RepID=A0A1C3NTG8_9ACTN|nr:hypothetical protein FDG2_0433 [Candidatus Protofrankia californiensis]